MRADEAQAQQELHQLWEMAKNKEKEFNKLMQELRNEASQDTKRTKRT